MDGKKDKVTGKVRYGKVVIEEGGQLSGEIEYGAPANTASTARTTQAAVRPLHTSAGTRVPGA